MARWSRVRNATTSENPKTAMRIARYDSAATARSIRRRVNSAMTKTPTPVTDVHQIVSSRSRELLPIPCPCRPVRPEGPPPPELSVPPRASQGDCVPTTIRPPSCYAVDQEGHSRTQRDVVRCGGVRYALYFVGPPHYNELYQVAFGCTTGLLAYMKLDLECPW